MGPGNTRLTWTGWISSSSPKAAILAWRHGPALSHIAGIQPPIKSLEEWAVSTCPTAHTHPVSLTAAGKHLLPEVERAAAAGAAVSPGAAHEQAAVSL